jgi:hypothetical protein
MKLDDLKTDIAKGNMHYRGPCHDCGASVFVEATLIEDGSIEISGGAVYKKKRGHDVRYFFKCDSCYKEDKTLRNWEECEVYSRVVGYLRPVSQYNIGKKEEYKMRKEFVNTVGK